MEFTIGKKLIFSILALLFVAIFIFNTSSNDTTAKIEKSIVANSNIETRKSKQEVLQISNQGSPVLQKKIAIEKKKLQDAKVLHKNILKSRETYLEQESKQRSKYLSYRARYQKASTQRVEQRLKSVKINKEKIYRQKYEQYNAAKRSQERSQVHKRTGLEKTRLKSLTNIQKKQLLYQKYKQGE